MSPTRITFTKAAQHGSATPRAQVSPPQSAHARAATRGSRQLAAERAAAGAVSLAFQVPKTKSQSGELMPKWLSESL